MAKVYMLTQQDIERLTMMVDRNPSHGTRGGSSHSMSDQERRYYDEAHGFYNYQVRTWIDEVTK